ncbi:MAG: hypothetical protein PHR61_01425 [Candidatus Absconditabacteria bacterium]|nr:hypothetical protein [Candidatus Absconditabacteria bacterium]
MTGILGIVDSGIVLQKNNGLDTSSSSINKQIIQQKEYIAVLEKTNESLSMRFNPYGIMISSLSVLFTAGAIIAAVMIFRQSEDYKKQLKKNQDNYESSLKLFLEGQEKIIKENNKKHEEIIESNKALIKEYKKKLNTATEEGKKEIEKAITKLEDQQNKIRFDSNIPTVNIESFNYGLGSSNSINLTPLNRNFVKCTKCGNGFFFQSPNSLSGIGLSDRLYVGNQATCPYCGTICYVN